MDPKAGSPLGPRSKPMPRRVGALQGIPLSASAHANSPEASRPEPNTPEIPSDDNSTRLKFPSDSSQPGGLLPRSTGDPLPALPPQKIQQSGSQSPAPSIPDALKAQRVAAQLYPVNPAGEPPSLTVRSASDEWQALRARQHLQMRETESVCETKAMQRRAAPYKAPDTGAEGPGNM